MIIYIKGGNENKPQLKNLSDRVYGRLYVHKGITNFYFGFTAHTVGYEEEFCDIVFEDKEDSGTRALLAFLEITGNEFDIICVEDEGNENEKAAIAKWEISHKQKPIPKKVSLPIVIIKTPVFKDDPYGSKSIPGIYGKLNCYKNKDRTERLVITNNYTKDGIAQAKSKFGEVGMEEYKSIFSDFGAPENPKDAEGLKDT